MKQLIIFLRSVRTCLRLLLCLLSLLFYFLVSLFVFLCSPFLTQSLKRRIASGLIRLFCLCLVRIINIKIEAPGARGSFSSNGLGSFLVSNHLGYVDGFVLGATFPLIYVGKAEIRRWPVIGQMSEVSGTLFIDRQRKNHVAEYIRSIADVLKGGSHVLFFPEGTSTNGETLLPFKSAFFEAPLIASAPIVPISIVYKKINGSDITKENRDTVYWYGDMTFAGHFFRLLFCDSVEVQVKIHAPVVFEALEEDRNLLRKLVTEAAYEDIRKDIKLIV